MADGTQNTLYNENLGKNVTSNINKNNRVRESGPPNSRKGADMNHLIHMRHERDQPHSRDQRRGAAAEQEEQTRRRAQHQDRQHKSEQHRPRTNGNGSTRQGKMPNGQFNSSSQNGRPQTGHGTQSRNQPHQRNAGINRNSHERTHNDPPHHNNNNNNHTKRPNPQHTSSNLNHNRRNYGRLSQRDHHRQRTFGVLHPLTHDVREDPSHTSDMKKSLQFGSKFRHVLPDINKFNLGDPRHKDSRLSDITAQGKEFGSLCEFGGIVQFKVPYPDNPLKNTDIINSHIGYAGIRLLAPAGPRLPRQPGQGGTVQKSPPFTPITKPSPRNPGSQPKPGPIHRPKPVRPISDADDGQIPKKKIKVDESKIRDSSHTSLGDQINKLFGFPWYEDHNNIEKLVSILGRQTYSIGKVKRSSTDPTLGNWTGPIEQPLSVSDQCSDASTEITRINYPYPENPNVDSAHISFSTQPTPVDVKSPSIKLKMAGLIGRPGFLPVTKESPDHGSNYIPVTPIEVQKPAENFKKPRGNFIYLPKALMKADRTYSELRSKYESKSVRRTSVDSSMAIDPSEQNTSTSKSHRPQAELNLPVNNIKQEKTKSSTSAPIESSKNLPPKSEATEDFNNTRVATTKQEIEINVTNGFGDFCGAVAQHPSRQPSRPFTIHHSLQHSNASSPPMSDNESDYHNPYDSVCASPNLLERAKQLVEKHTKIDITNKSCKAKQAANNYVSKILQVCCSIFNGSSCYLKHIIKHRKNDSFDAQENFINEAIIGLKYCTTALEKVVNGEASKLTRDGRWESKELRRKYVNLAKQFMSIVFKVQGILNTQLWNRKSNVDSEKQRIYQTSNNTNNLINSEGSCAKAEEFETAIPWVEMTHWINKMDLFMSRKDSREVDREIILNYHLQAKKHLDLARYLTQSHQQWRMGEAIDEDVLRETNNLQPAGLDFKSELLDEARAMGEAANACLELNLLLDSEPLCLSITSSLEQTEKIMNDFNEKMNDTLKKIKSILYHSKNHDTNNNATNRPSKNSKSETNDSKPQSSNLKRSLPVS